MLIYFVPGTEDQHPPLLRLGFCCLVSQSSFTELFDELLHVEVEGVDDGAPRLVVIVVDCYSCEPASDLALLVHVHLHIRAKVLAKEMGGGAASNPCSNHS